MFTFQRKVYLTLISELLFIIYLFIYSFPEDIPGPIAAKRGQDQKVDKEGSE